MLPQAYELPAALLLVLGGALACFAGYRLFRIVLAIYGFILGAMIASSMMGVSNTLGMIVAALVGGLVGALILVFAYFVGIALVGAGLGALVAHVGWTLVRQRRSAGAADHRRWRSPARSPRCSLQRYVIIVTTAFGGAWTIDRRRSGGGRRPRRAARQRRRACGFCIRRRRRRASGGCRARGSRSGWSAPPCSWRSPAGRRSSRTFRSAVRAICNLQSAI